MWVILGLAVLAGVGGAVYFWWSTPPPFEGVWKIEEQYDYNPTLKQWVEKLADSGSPSHAQFKDGLFCPLVSSGDSGFTCSGALDPYTVSGDVISFPSLAVPTRLRWGLTGDTLELIAERVSDSEWQLQERFVVTRVVED